jgi:hypothetical protein
VPRVEGQREYALTDFLLIRQENPAQERVYVILQLTIKLVLGDPYVTENTQYLQKNPSAPGLLRVPVEDELRELSRNLAAYDQKRYDRFHQQLREEQQQQHRDHMEVLRKAHQMDQEEMQQITMARAARSQWEPWRPRTGRSYRHPSPCADPRPRRRPRAKVSSQPVRLGSAPSRTSASNTTSGTTYAALPASPFASTPAIPTRFKFPGPTSTPFEDGYCGDDEDGGNSNANTGDGSANKFNPTHHRRTLEHTTTGDYTTNTEEGGTHSEEGACKDVSMGGEDTRDRHEKLAGSGDQSVGTISITGDKNTNTNRGSKENENGNNAENSDEHDLDPSSRNCDEENDVNDTASDTWSTIAVCGGEKPVEYCALHRKRMSDLKEKHARLFRRSDRELQEEAKLRQELGREGLLRRAWAEEQRRVQHVNATRYQPFSYNRASSINTVGNNSTNGASSISSGSGSNAVDNNIQSGSHQSGIVAGTSVGSSTSGYQKEAEPEAAESSGIKGAVISMTEKGCAMILTFKNHLAAGMRAVKRMVAGARGCGWQLEGYTTMAEAEDFISMDGFLHMDLQTFMNSVVEEDLFRCLTWSNLAEKAVSLKLPSSPKVQVSKSNYYSETEGVITI